MSANSVVPVATVPEVSLDVFKKAVLKASRKKNLKPSQVAALRLYAQLHFGLPANSPSKVESGADEVQKFQIGSVIVQDGRKYRVVAQEIE
jgi:hypothetical protein